MTAEQDLQALNLRRAGVSIPKIAGELGFRTRASCEKAIARAMAAQGLTTDPISVRLAELDRLDRLQLAVWAKATGGNLEAVDRVLRLAEMRLRIAGIAEAGLTPITAEYDRTIDDLGLTGKARPAALVALGRRLCEQIDAASAVGDAQTVTKALYLVPHVVNVLRELGAGPEAVDTVRGAAPAAPATASDDLAAMRERLKSG